MAYFGELFVILSLLDNNRLNACHVMCDGHTPVDTHAMYIASEKLSYQAKPNVHCEGM